MIEKEACECCGQEIWSLSEECFVCKRNCCLNCLEYIPENDHISYRRVIMLDFNIESERGYNYGNGKRREELYYCKDCAKYNERIETILKDQFNAMITNMTLLTLDIRQKVLDQANKKGMLEELDNKFKEWSSEKKK